MRKISAFFILILILSSTQNSFAGETNRIISGRAYPIIELPTDTFAELPFDQREEFLRRREADLAKIQAEIDALNLMGGDDLVKQIKRDRCCAKGFKFTSYFTGSALVLGGIITSAIDVVPQWMGYVVAGVAVAEMFFVNRGDFFQNRAVSAQEELEAFWEELAKDYIAKKKAHEQQLEIEALREENYRLRGGNGDDDVILVPQPRVLTRQPRIELARVARTAPQNDDVFLDMERMQEVELADADMLSPAPIHARQGRERVANPQQAKAPLKSPSPKKKMVKVKKKKNKSRSPNTRAQPKPQQEEEIVVEKDQVIIEEGEGANNGEQVTEL